MSLKEKCGRWIQYVYNSCTTLLGFWQLKCFTHSQFIFAAHWVLKLFLAVFLEYLLLKLCASVGNWVLREILHSVLSDSTASLKQILVINTTKYSSPLHLSARLISRYIKVLISKKDDVWNVPMKFLVPPIQEIAQHLFLCWYLWMPRDGYGSKADLPYCAVEDAPEAEGERLCMAKSTWMPDRSPCHVFCICICYMLTNYLVIADI